MSSNGVRPVAGKPAIPEAAVSRKWGREREGFGFDFSAVDMQLVRATLHVCVAANCSVQFGLARGGFGVAVQPYQHPVKFETMVAINPAQFHELLWFLIDEFGSKSEDVCTMFGLTR